MTMTSIPMIFKMDDPTEVSQMVAVMSLGMCAAILHGRGSANVAGSLSIDDAERRLFNPQVLARLTELGLPEALIEIVHLGTELEDVQSLVPDRLDESLTQMQAKALAFLNQDMGRSPMAA
jgi:Protein of unknown function (DUF3969)